MEIRDTHRYCNECAIHSRYCPCLDGGARCFAEGDAHLFSTDSLTASQLIHNGLAEVRNRKVGVIGQRYVIKGKRYG